MKVDNLCADAPQLVRWKNCSCETASGRNASAIRAPWEFKACSASVRVLCLRQRQREASGK
jgi:hypothetical protein